MMSWSRFVLPRQLEAEVERGFLSIQLEAISTKLLEMASSTMS